MIFKHTKYKHIDIYPCVIVGPLKIVLPAADFSSLAIVLRPGSRNYILVFWKVQHIVGYVREGELSSVERRVGERSFVLFFHSIWTRRGQYVPFKGNYITLKHTFYQQETNSNPREPMGSQKASLFRHKSGLNITIMSIFFTPPHRGKTEWRNVDIC